MTPLRLGTRGSKLARWQANAVATEIRRRSGRNCELVIITTTGDHLTDIPLSTVGGKRLFVKEIEKALVHEEIDLAVHSAKDMPAVEPDGLTVAAVLPREDPRDVFVLPAGVTPASHLPFSEVVASQATEPRIGSSSVRRIAQLRQLLPTARFRPVRGNVGSRLRKLDNGWYDLLILAAAGLRRLGFKDRISAAIDVKACVPAPGQGIIAIETREDDLDTIATLTDINDTVTTAALTAERAVVTALDGGCQVPIGVFAEPRSGVLHVNAVVASLDGSLVLQREATGPIELAHTIGTSVAVALLEDGAGPVLQAARDVDPLGSPPHTSIGSRKSKGRQNK